MSPEIIIPYLMQVGDQIRIFHWQTKDYAEHKALGAYYDDVSAMTDDFAEVMLGVAGERPKLNGSIKLENYEASMAVPYLQAVAKELVSWRNLSTDLLNMRDDLLGKTHRTIYLLSLK